MNVRKHLLAALFLVVITSCKGNTVNEDKYAFAKAETQENITASNLKTAPYSIRVALLLDTSNSMDGLIEQAKSQLWELVNELSYAKCGNDTKPSLQIALYEYGNDRLNAREGYIKQVIPLSSDLDEISKQLFELTTNGGNEYCGQVIQTSLEQLNWGNRDNDLNLIFIAGNEPFTQGPIRYQDAAANACEKDVTINTIFCGNYNEGVNTNWKNGADLTKGSYIAINSDKQTVHIPSPYDDRILERNKALNNTYVAYGSLGTQKLQEQSTQDSNANNYGEANAVKRVVSKSSHFYKNESWDLVDAEENENFSYDKLDTSTLPKELQGKNKSEIVKYVATKRQERERIQEEIALLNKMRRDYVAKKQKKGENELQNALLNAIKKQARAKHYSWDN
ncbi:VWA domain-containing protein [Dokdonia sinensis]|uniref:VWA domain-containing protein n=1 Tax=Dokdonia sinensis TaxID=2479847 RepID=A0A3M0G5V3_9FLAO|nr:vWA domain-containing protein [Dokdonia sinensis]RMB57173.1 VWA domain-containing protein [Dokdonia sinensis]